jgi:hypothetical protein
MASLSCASILCAVVLLITKGSIRHAVESMFAVAILGSTISQHGDRESSRCLPAYLSLRHLLGIAVQGRSLHSGLPLCGGFSWRISAADFCEFPADFRGGFSRRISAADFAADHRRILSISCGGFCGGFFSGPKPCKLHIKIAPKIHHKNPPHSSPHARLV